MDKKRALSILTILLVGLFFRLYDLSGESIWLDEGLSIEFANLNLSQIFFLHDTSPPLYYILLHWWIHLFGISEFSVRFPSAILGCLSVFMMYKIGSQLFDNYTGIFSSLLMAFSVFHIQYSQEARTYSLTVLLTLFSMYFFIKLLREMSYINLIGYVIFSILLIYSHIYGLFIIIAQNIHFIVLSLISREPRKLNIIKWSSTQSLLILLFAPWISTFANQVAKVQEDYWITKPNIATIIFSFKTYSSESILLLLLFLALLPFSFISYEKLQGNMEGKNFFKSLESYQWRIRLLNTDKVYFLFIWMITPVILPFIISRLSQPIYVTRYTIVASSAFYLLVARGISNMQSKHVKSIAIGIVIILSLLSVRGYYNNINKEQLREAAEYIKTYANAGDMLLFTPSYYTQAFNCYIRNDHLFKKGFPVDGGKAIDEKDINILWDTVARYNRVWVILSAPGDEKEEIPGTLIKSYNLSRHKAYKDVKLFLFEKRRTSD